MPSCMELYFVRSILRNLLEATPKLHLRHDCARHIDPNMDKFHPQTIQQNEYWEAPRDGRNLNFLSQQEKFSAYLPHAWELLIRTSAAFTFVWNLVVESVWPNGDFIWWHNNARIVDEAKVLDDLILSISTWLQERCSHAIDFGIGYVWEMSKNLSHSNHFAHPLLVAFILQSLLQTDGFHSYFVASVREILNLKIIAVRMMRIWWKENVFGIARTLIVLLIWCSLSHMQTIVLCKAAAR